LLSLATHTTTPGTPENRMTDGYQPRKAPHSQPTGVKNIAARNPVTEKTDQQASP